MPHFFSNSTQAQMPQPRHASPISQHPTGNPVADAAPQRGGDAMVHQVSIQLPAQVRSFLVSHTDQEESFDWETTSIADGPGGAGGQAGPVMAPPCGGEHDAGQAMTDILNTGFVDFYSEGSASWELESIGSDPDDSLSVDFSHLQVQATPSYLASPTRSLSPSAPGQELPRDTAPLLFDLDAWTEVMSSDGSVQLFLTGCAQEHNGTPQGGYHQ